ncbi:MAG TPA: hypothetical protein VE570_15175 [Thermoleophilaceae bacterium]|nr:hypothetical protein [Thermoleophilaceae bacterium]
MKKVLLGAIALALALPAVATADGLPLLGIDAGDGVVSADGSSRYVAFAATRDSLVARIHVDGGRVARHRALRGSYTIPAVAADGSGDGLAADERTLVLIRPRSGLAQRRTRLLVVDPKRRFAIKRQIVLRGDFSFDAISPDGSKLYMVQYHDLTRRNFDPTNYSVRVVDTATGRLDGGPIVDPREPGEKMGGWPVTRAMSRDHRWAYTLYSGTEHPFVHALDTVGRTARCIDLDALTGRQDLFQLRLRPAHGGRDLQIVKDGKPELVVDTRSFDVKPVQAATRARAQRPRGDGDSDGTGVWPYAGAALLLALLGLASAKPLARATRSR